MNLFQFICSALPILDVISDHVALKPAGHYWKGPCPFHSETDASFTVSPDRQMFYCFGCHASGDVIAFMAKLENAGQYEAAQMLIERYKLKIPEDLLRRGEGGGSNPAVQEVKARAELALKTVAQWCHDSLMKNRGGYEYLTNRGLQDATIKQFQIGLFPGGVQGINTLMKEMGRLGILTKDLIEAGVLSLGEKSGHYYSPFEERIIFPIKDHFGRFCGLGGRIYKSGDDRAKYYNSKEAEWFVKGKILFGLDSAKKAMQQAGAAFLVEGYMDCVAMAQAGFANTVATLGTACTIEHLKALARYANILYVLYDGDQAGQKAILRITEICWEVNLELRVIRLPAKEDPASLLFKGVDLTSFIASAQDIVAFFVRAVVADFFKRPLAEKLTALHKIFDIVSKALDPLKRDLLLQQAAAQTDLPLSTLKEGLEYYQKTKRSRVTPAFAQEAERGSEEVVAVAEGQEGVVLDELEEKILFVILKRLEVDSSPAIEDELIPYFSPLVKELLASASEMASTSGGFSINRLLESADEQQRRVVNRVLIAHDSQVSQELLLQLKRLFCKQHWKKIVRDFKLQIAEAQQASDAQRVQELLTLFSRFKQGFAQEGLV